MYREYSLLQWKRFVERNQRGVEITGNRGTYNRLIGSSELIKMIQYHLSSNVLTLNILKHPEEIYKAIK